MLALKPGVFMFAVLLAMTFGPFEKPLSPVMPMKIRVQHGRGLS